MAVEIVSSNRLEVLGERFAARLRQEPPPPLAAEPVLVQSRGMARWLDLLLAEQNGIAAGVEYLFPNNFIDNLLAAQVPDAAVGRNGMKEELAWRIAALLEEEETAAEARDYAAVSGLHRIQLAFVLADLFDQYTVYRPEMILEWEKGADDHWQARLWRRLRQDWREPHRAALLARLGGDGVRASSLPPRLSVFGVSSLPPKTSSSTIT